MATLGTNTIRIEGIQATVRYGYQRAADLGAWKVEGDWFVASVKSFDGFVITQTPLTLEIPNKDGDPTRRPLTDVTVYRGAAVRATAAQTPGALMSNRYRKQEDHRIELSEGDWLLVRKHLTAGEERDAQAKVIKAGTFRPGEKPELDLEHLGIAQAVSYLIDWSITDADDKPIRIRDQGYDFVAAALKNQTPESLREILEAIQAHDAAMTAERDHQKKAPTGEPVPSPTSTSVA